MTAESIIQKEAAESIIARRNERTAKKIVQEITDAPPVAPERITADELAELRSLQEMITEYQQRIAQMQEAAVKAVGAFEYVIARLQARYGLGERDSVDEHGVIKRAAPDVPASDSTTEG